MKQFEEAGAKVFVVIPHERCRVKWWQDRSGAISVLADAGFWVSSMYGVAFQMRIHTDVSNTPATFVIDRNGVVRWAHIGEGERNWSDRPKEDETLAKVKEFAK